VFVLADEPMQRAQLCAWLRADLGVEILSIRDAAEAAARAAASPPTVVVAHVGALPGLREVASLRAVPIVAIAPIRRQGLRAGAAAAVGRPVDRTELGRAVRQLIDRAPEPPAG